MGDVFDALRRARDGAPAANARHERPEGPAASDEHPGALPLDEMHAALARQANADHSFPTPPIPVSQSESAPPIVDPGSLTPTTRGTSRQNPAPPTPQPEASSPPVSSAPAPIQATAEAPPSRQAVIQGQFRQVRDTILQRSRQRGTRLHAFASPTATDGRTATVLHLATCFTEVPGQRVLLLEGDLRTPSLHRYFQKPFTPGLVHLLRGKARLEHVLYPTRQPNFQVLPAGDCEFNDSRALLASQEMADLLRDLRDRYDHIFIDCPALTTAGDDACALAPLADECLLIVRMHKTPPDVLDRAKRRLHQAGAPITGTIVSHA